MHFEKLRTALALKIAPWIVPETALQEMKLVLDAAPKSERDSHTHTLIKTLIASYRNQAKKAKQ
ncbi:hypothetical protein [Vreelandella alkaliphila]|uniref:Uncharacterized protein n=1 Tax=Vreelandella alkaliphila TaxID=272774 RepID=A0AAJ2S485_9GAMM|nr:hypothetical protein [Halomonas alkaliphila]MDX5979591.1 hypothetical protein [Halomonas alkaliphila]